MCDTRTDHAYVHLTGRIVGIKINGAIVAGTVVAPEEGQDDNDILVQTEDDALHVIRWDEYHRADFVNARLTRVTDAALAPGTVFTFTRDLSAILGPRWTNRIPGTHFVVTGGLSESGYTFSCFNTRTQRHDDMMAESWVYAMLRIIWSPNG